MKKTNYHTFKDSELMQRMDEYHLDYNIDKFARKEAIDAIKDVEAKIASGEVVLIEEDGKIADMPKLECWKVMFHSTDTQDLPYIYVGHNGKGFVIPREEEVDVPIYILQSCIKDAVEERSFAETINGEIRMKKRKVQRFPYTIIDTNPQID